MTKLRVTVDLPGVDAAAFSGTDFLGVALETVRLARQQVPATQASSLDLVEIGDNLQAPGAADITFDSVLSVNGTNDSGGAAPYTVTGILATSTLVAVVRAKEATGVTTDVVAGFTVTDDDEVTGDAVDYSDSKLSFYWYDVEAI